MGERGELFERRDAWHDARTESPHRQVDVRAGGGHVYTIVNADTGEVIGTADEHRAFATLHPGAVYLHMGEQFLVRELDLVDRVAAVEPPTRTTTRRRATSPTSRSSRSSKRSPRSATSALASARCS